MSIPFFAKQAQLEAKIADWSEIAGPRLRVDSVNSFSRHKVYALTLTDPAVPLERKRRHYFAQPHAHDDTAWGQRIVDAWARAGYRPVPKPIHLGYTGEQAEYFRRNWGELHKRMRIINTEVKNNAADAPPGFQLKAQAIAIEESIRRLV
ncbi:MAG: hypothetical protein FJ291_28935 [Planctomycetes bacterium]|nr:hypothetical protein [Planctomycetota bacterium]